MLSITQSPLLFVLMLQHTENNNVPKIESAIEILFTLVLRLMFESIALICVNRRLKIALNIDFIVM